MDRIIKGLESLPFSGEDLLKVTDHKTHIIRYKDLAKYKSIDQVLKPHGSVVILYETKPSYGHWVGLIRQTPKKGRPYLEFFDSYGMAPDQQLQYIDRAFRERGGEAYPLLSHLLHDSGYEVTYNNERLQRLRDAVATCGRHVGFRIAMRHLPLGEYVKIMTSSKKYTPDELVSLLTAFSN
jgi:hypothetical protein